MSLDPLQVLGHPLRIAKDRFPGETTVRRLPSPRLLPPVAVRAIGAHTAILMPCERTRGHGVKTPRRRIPLVRCALLTENSIMKKQTKKTSPASPRVHESREDRARTLAGKTANSKVRSEGRTLAAQERSAKKKRSYSAAAAAKKRP